MSRVIPRNKPLSEQDKKYLLMRGKRIDMYPTADPEESEEEEVQTKEPDDDYDEWKVSELRAELEERELSTEGNKPALVARLREHDASNPE